MIFFIRKMLAVICCFFLTNAAFGVPVEESLTVKNCGTTTYSQSATERIIGGKKVKHGQDPWMVSIHQKLGRGFIHLCGGSILNENWIITAAHCINYKKRKYVKKPSSFLVYAGLHKLSKLNSPTVQQLKISKIILHKDYNDSSLDNDIALLKTATPINIAGSNGYVNGICLPKSNADPTGDSKVLGWGHTKKNGENSDTLLQVTVPLIDRDLCNEVYDYDPDDDIDRVTNAMICAGQQNKDSCQSDSGGPLLQTNSAGVSTLIGIVSFGSGCGYRHYPGVYTKVASYKQWMKKIVSDN